MAGRVFALPLVLIVSVAGFVSGCAEVHVKPVSSTDRTTEGVRYFRSYPYLLVTLGPAPKPEDKPAQGTGTGAAPGAVPTTAPTTQPSPTLNLQIVWLPKADEAYAVSVKPGFGTADGSVKLKDGWMLTDFGSKVDSKIPETITATAGLLTAVSGAITALDNNSKTILGNKKVLGPGLYRFKFDGNGYVTGLEPITLIP